jgi:hypothetical protein
LRAGSRRLLQELLPDVRIDPPPPGGTLDPAALFARRPEAVWLEIGFGSGEHLAWQAARNPGIGIVGAEYFVNGVAALLRQIEDRGLDNVRILQGDARPLMDALPAKCLARAFILFPDPWPKARHHKRRIVRRETLVKAGSWSARRLTRRFAGWPRVQATGARGRPTGRPPDTKKRQFKTGAAPPFCAFGGGLDARPRPASGVKTEALERVDSWDGKALRAIGLERRVRDPYGCDAVLDRAVYQAPPKVGQRPTFFVPSGRTGDAC